MFFLVHVLIDVYIYIYNLGRAMHPVFQPTLSRHHRLECLHGPASKEIRNRLTSQQGNGSAAQPFTVWQWGFGMVAQESTFETS